MVTKLAACVLVGCVAACSATTSARTSTTADLAGRTFDITSITYDGTAEPIVAGSRPTFAFDASQLQVVTGCNQMTAHYVVVADRLTVTDAMSTVMGCSPALSAQELRISQVLDGTAVLESAADGYTVTAGPVTLVLSRT